MKAAIAKSEALKSIQGTRLEPLTAMLATQPVMLHKTIIDAATSMLDLSTNIKQRESSY